MEQNAADEARQRKRANDLYWTSDESVNQIAENLDLSKGSLYGLVAPLPAGLPCPRCSAEMEYPNRTAREKGFLTCPACELEEDEAEVRGEWKEAAARRSADDALVVSPGSGPAARSRGFLPQETRTRVILGTALIGAAAGLAVALWTRRK